MIFSTRKNRLCKDHFLGWQKCCTAMYTVHHRANSNWTVTHTQLDTPLPKYPLTANEGPVQIQYIMSGLCIPRNETALPRYFQNIIIMFCLPISTFMYLWAIYIFRDQWRKYINRWQISECRNWEWGRSVSFLGWHVSNFRYSALAFISWHTHRARYS